jgi:hypothetical protein
MAVGPTSRSGSIGSISSIVCTTLFVAGSIATTPDSVDTHTRPPPKAILRVVPASRWIFACTRVVSGSIRHTSGWRNHWRAASSDELSPLQIASSGRSYLNRVRWFDSGRGIRTTAGGNGPLTVMCVMPARLRRDPAREPTEGTERAEEVHALRGGRGLDRRRGSV